MEQPNWENIYVKLYAYADQLLKAHSWFRGKGTNSFLQGKQPHDYVAQAIESYLSSPEKYDPSSGRSLCNYLKYHIIRRLISNDAKSLENRSTIQGIDDFQSNNDSENNLSNLESILPIFETFFDQEIDYNHILNEVKKQLKNDSITSLIFDEVRCKGLNRRELIKEHKLQDSEFDNAMKRLNRILKEIAKKYHLK
ncbi:MAG: hypothetical protein WCP74_12005 [Sphingobacteriia bacterium]